MELKELPKMQIEKIHAEFRKILHQYIATHVRDRDDAADLLQEVFIKMVLDAWNIFYRPIDIAHDGDADKNMKPTNDLTFCCCYHKC